MPVSEAFDPPCIPPWLRGKREDTLADAAFMSGGALAHLDHVLTMPAVPLPVLRARLALVAAELCKAHMGRPERLPALRDALHLLRPGDLPGPAGEVATVWHRVAARPLSAQVLAGVLPRGDAALIAQAMATARKAPIPHAAALLDAALAHDPRGRTDALILADAALSRALGWTHLVPLLTLGLTRAALQTQGADLQMACHLAVTRAVPQVLRHAADLARQAQLLQAALPRLRAKAAGQAVALFLTRDAVAPGALTGFMSDRAARRLCDRLVSLGAVRELTGRDSFRLYGL